MSLEDPAGSIVFEAEYDYDPTGLGEIKLRVGDKCVVQKSNADPKGWLSGYNTRTREQGEFPGTYCKIVNVQSNPPLPPKPTQKRTICNGHNLIKKQLSKPVFCEHCTDFVWGGSTSCLICTGCHKFSHVNCHKIFLEGSPCFASSGRTHSIPNDLKKPIHEWDNSEVLEWMVAAHLNPYLLLMKEKNVEGDTLFKLSKEILLSIGIPFEFHCFQFMECVTELKTSQAFVETQIDLSDQPLLIETHNLIEHTFTTHQKCELCYKSMFGIIRQGVMCLECGVQYHRYCAVSCKEPCSGKYIRRGRRASDSNDPSFCCNFQSPLIPPVMMQCITAVTNSGLHTQHIYKNECSYEESISLRVALNQDPNNVNLNDRYWSNPLCAAYVLKTFLLELPIPLIPFECYQQFIDLTSDVGDGEQAAFELIRQLPEPNRSHLDFLLQHLVSVDRENEHNMMDIQQLSHIFSILILRPTDGESRVLVQNLGLQEKVVSLLLTVAKRQMDQPNTPASITSTDSDLDFDEPKWLWPDATRKDISQRLSGTPDGSFSIRQSERSKGEWTLTVRKEGRERLIRIIQRNGRYGFREELLNFDSLKDLVLYFRDHSLEDYNAQLKVTLMYPCGKPDQIVVGGNDGTIILKRYEELDNKLNHVKYLELKLEGQQTSLEQCKVLCESQIDVVNFLEEQIHLAEQFYKEASSRDLEDLKTSIETMNNLLIDEKDKWKELDETLTSLKQECDEVNTQLTELSAEVPALQEEYNQLYQEARRLYPARFGGKEEEEAKDLEDLEKIYEDLPRTTPYNSVNSKLHEESWLYRTRIGRDIAKQILEDKPDGTFLVRESSNFPYVISMVHDTSVKHIPILRGPNGYGFAEPHNIYRTLSDLVNHYHHQSLRMHNRLLDTTLAFPVRFLNVTEDEPIYD